MAKLSHIMTVRITPELQAATEKCANRLKLRSADIVRYLLANALEELEQPGRKEQESFNAKREERRDLLTPFPTKPTQQPEPSVGSG